MHGRWKGEDPMLATLLSKDGILECLAWKQRALLGKIKNEGLNVRITIESRGRVGV